MKFGVVVVELSTHSEHRQIVWELCLNLLTRKAQAKCNTSVNVCILYLSVKLNIKDWKRMLNLWISPACVLLQLWAVTLYSGADRQDWFLVDRSARSGRDKWRGRLQVGQRLTAGLHSLGQKPTRCWPNSNANLIWAGKYTLMKTIKWLFILFSDNGAGTCVAMTTGQIGGFWDDKQCSDLNAFVCEKPRPDITPPTKAPTPPPAQGCADGWTALPHFRNCYKVGN